MSLSDLKNMQLWSGDVAVYVHEVRGNALVVVDAASNHRTLYGCVRDGDEVRTQAGSVLRLRCP